MLLTRILCIEVNTMKSMNILVIVTPEGLVKKLSDGLEDKGYELARLSAAYDELTQDLIEDYPESLIYIKSLPKEI